MRWLFLLMVAVNIAIYVWGLQHETDTSAALDPRYNNIGEIILLSKADIERSATDQPSVNGDTGEPLVSSKQRIGDEDNSSTITLEASESDITQEPALYAGDEISENDDTGEPVVSSEQRIGDEGNSSTITPEASESALTQEPALSAGMEAEAVVNATAPEGDSESTETTISPPPLIPAAEVTEEPPPALVEESETAEAETVVVQQMFCWTLGPIQERPGALTILETVEKMGVSALLREEIEKTITGYWVVLPPYENASTASKVVKQLQARDVIDVQRFYRGEFQNGVSLGVYNRRFNAEKRKAQIETKGFFPEVLPRVKEVPRFWVDCQTASDIDILGNLPSEFRDLVATQRTCDTQPNY